MNTKLTLTIEEEVIKKAKEYVKDKNVSLSEIIENYLKTLTKQSNKKSSKKFAPVVTSLKGSFKIPSKDFDYKKELRNRLSEKYSLMDKILIDTDVLLDFFYDKNHFHLLP